VADLRSRVSRVATAASFLSDEMRTRTLNPAWINGLKAEGYAGTLEILNQVNNLWGWQVTDPATVRADQWQAVHDTFVRGIRQLETHNQTAQAQMLERMVEAIRKNYWNASAQTRRELAERWQQLKEAGLETGAPATREFVAAMTAGFGITVEGSTPSNEVADASPPPPNPEVDGAAPATVSGPVLTSVAAPRAEEAPWSASILGLLALAFLAAGAVHQCRANARAQPRFGVPV
jgi:cobaltochelatase CobN